MSVFDGKTKIGRSVADPNTDKTLPPSGSLGWSAITGQTALGVTVGSDVALVHGDQWQSVDTDRTHKIGGSGNSTIEGDENRKVSGDHNKQISGDQNQIISGDHNLNVSGQSQSLFVGPKTDVHVAPLCIMHSATQCTSEPQPKIHILGVEFEKKDSEFTFCTNSFDINVISNEINLAFKNELTTLNNEVKVILDFATVLGVSIEPKVSEVEIEALHTFLKGGHAEVTAGKVTAAPGVNAVPGVPTSHQ